MGLFDLFEEANEKFKKDVGKAWDELWDNDTSDDDDDDDESSSSVLGELFRPHIPDLDGGIGGHLVGLKNLEKILPGKSLPGMGIRCSEPIPGTPVYCNLAVAVEHTGIYVGDNEIVQLNGDGNIEIVSPREFLARLDGLNPAVSIYCACRSGKALGRKVIADRARSMVGSRRDYSLVFDNCHQFTCGCISGDFENPCNFFWMVENEIRAKLGAFTWAEWDY